MARFIDVNGRQVAEKYVSKGMKDALYLCAVEAYTKNGGDIRKGYITKMDILYDDIRSENVKYSDPFTLATIDILSMDIVFDGYSTKRKYHIEDKKSVNFRVFWEVTYNKVYWELASDRNDIVAWLSKMK